MLNSRRYFWIAVLLLLLAAGLRLYGLTTAPPGLTHDEADHGLDAWGVVQGIRPVYFTVGFGREPLFDYATALLMAGAGRTFLAGRLTAVYFSLLLVAGTYAWTRRAFDRPVALAAMAGVALSFWPLMTGRQALRSGVLPALFVLAMAWLWSTRRRGRRQRRLGPFLGAGLLLGLTFYTYIPSRALWLLPVLWLLYLALARQSYWRVLAPRLGLCLALAGLISLPLWRYLAQNPGAEARIDQLSGPLSAARAGDWTPLLTNAAGALRLFTSAGDSAWRYNIAGRPLLDPVMGLLFYAGLLLAAWYALSPRRQRSQATWADGSAVTLAWLAIGLAPALITGPELSTTQAIGMQPVLYVLPALALVSLGRRLLAWQPAWRRWLPPLAALLFAAVGLLTVRDYFGRWAVHPEVRVQYESTLIETVAYLNQHGRGPAGISTTTPGRFHTPAVVALTLTNDVVQPRYFAGRGSLLLPAGSSQLFFSGFAPLNEQLRPLLMPLDGAGEIPLAAGDLDSPLTYVLVDSAAIAAGWQQELTWLPAPVTFGGGADLLAYQLPATARAGQTLPLIVLWAPAGPTTVDLTQFTHLTAGDGAPLAQADRLDAPSRFWAAGDWLLQLHELMLPADLAAGTYDLRVGLYDANSATFQRLPVAGGGDSFILTQVTIE